MTWTLNLRPHLLRYARLRAEREGVSLSTLFEQILRAAIAREIAKPDDGRTPRQQRMIDRLRQKYRQPRQRGRLAGRIWIADDFDEDLELARIARERADEESVRVDINDL